MELFTQTLGSGEPLVILHGLFGDGDNWKSVAKALSNQFEVTLVDLRNHGRSFHSNEMNYAIMAEDIEKLLDKLSLKSPLMLGHSMGGKVAMQLALMSPESIQKLVVVDIAPKTYAPNHNNVFTTLNGMDIGLYKSRKEIEETLKQGIDDSAVRSFLMKSLFRDEQKNFDWRFNLPALEKQYSNIAASPTDEGTFTGPTLFIKGGDSNYIQAEDQPRILELFPNAKAKIISGAGHWPQAQKPQVFIKILSDFLQAG